MENTIIKTPEIKQLFKEYCKENELEFSQNKFEIFLKFLEIDFYDWVKQNLKHYEIKRTY